MAESHSTTSVRRICPRCAGRKAVGATACHSCRRATILEAQRTQPIVCPDCRRALPASVYAMRADGSGLVDRARCSKCKASRANTRWAALSRAGAFRSTPRLAAQRETVTTTTGAVVSMLRGSGKSGSSRWSIARCSPARWPGCELRLRRSLVSRNASGRRSTRTGQCLRTVLTLGPRWLWTGGRNGDGYGAPVHCGLFIDTLGSPSRRDSSGQTRLP